MSLSCFGLGSQQTNDLRILVGEQKTELERLQRENASLVTQIEAHKRAQADSVAASAKDVNGLRLRISELEIDLDKHKASNLFLKECRDTDHDAARLNKQIQARVAHFHLSRNQLHNELIFKKHANQATNLMTVNAMTAALRELGVQLTQDEAAVVFESVDTDENGGLDLQEFTKAINHPSRVQQWIETLPLSPLLAHCLSFKGGVSSDPLREVSRLSADELRASTQAYCDSAQKLLADALQELKRCYDAMDALASSAGNSKFQTPKMSAGSVEEFYQGLVGRVGECCFSGIECSRVLSLAALCRRPAPGPCQGHEGRALRQGRLHRRFRHQQLRLADEPLQ
jgi:hypothetical protein